MDDLDCCTNSIHVQNITFRKLLFPSHFISYFQNQRCLKSLSLSHYLLSPLPSSYKNSPLLESNGQREREREREREKSMDFKYLEITLISAQSLKNPAMTNLRRMQTYAITWVDPTAKLQTRIDRVGGENPTWNDKFIFRVPSSFLSSSSSTAISIQIYAVGFLFDTLIGTVHLLVANLRLSPSPSFSAFQIRRPSSRFHGILNVGATLLSASLLSSIIGAAVAIGYRDLMGGKRTVKSGGSSSAGDSDSLVKYSNEVDSDSPRVLKDWSG